MELAPPGGARNAEQNRLLALNYIHGGEEPLVCSAHAAWGAAFASQFEPLPPPEPRPSTQHASSGSSSWSYTEGPGREVGAELESLSRPLGVGYVSPDLFTHSVSYFAEAPLAHHDPRRCAPHTAAARTPQGCRVRCWLRTWSFCCVRHAAAT